MQYILLAEVGIVVEPVFNGRAIAETAADVALKSLTENVRARVPVHLRDVAIKLNKNIASFYFADIDKTIGEQY